MLAISVRRYLCDTYGAKTATPCRDGRPHNSLSCNFIPRQGIEPRTY